MTFIITYFNDILIALTSIITGASAISALTPTTKDDAFWSKVKKVLNFCALNVGNAKPLAA
ncbi:MAG: hypothetical protein J6T55_01495 [Alphaproteobacteria bacterium]|nr:hypothetical protein [Alphaproteobacteria bacterium]